MVWKSEWSFILSQIQMFYDIDVDKSGAFDCDGIRGYLIKKEFDECFITVYMKRILQIWGSDFL